MLAPLPSVIDSEPVPSEHPEISQPDSSFARKYSSYEDLGHKFSAWGRPKETLGYINIP